MAIRGSSGMPPPGNVGVGTLCGGGLGECLPLEMLEVELSVVAIHEQFMLALIEIQHDFIIKSHSCTPN